MHPLHSLQEKAERSHSPGLADGYETNDILYVQFSAETEHWASTCVSEMISSNGTVGDSSK